MTELASQLITFYQALQLVGLAPCLFILLFLSIISHQNRQAFVPLLYFSSLFASFLLPLLELSHNADKLAWLRVPIVMLQSMLVASCFLLILQFMLGKIPPFRYWFVLLVPILGGGFILYASQIAAPEHCDIAAGCFNEQTATTLYNLFSSALVVLLLLYYTIRFKFRTQDARNKHHHYWLAVTLVLLHLALPALDLLGMIRRITDLSADFCATVIKLSFIYLVLTSLFRVYYPPLIIEAPALPKHDEDADKLLLARLLQLLDEQHIYREMRLNRAALASKLNVGENMLSRVMNSYLGHSFNEIINMRRIEDAKQRLIASDAAVAAIGSEVGFNSTASFNRVFRELAGCSPTQYRQQKPA